MVVVAVVAVVGGQQQQGIEVWIYWGGSRCVETERLRSHGVTAEFSREICVGPLA